MVMSSRLFITPTFFSAFTTLDLHQVLALKLLLRSPTACLALGYPPTMASHGCRFWNFQLSFSSRVAPVY